MKLRSILSLLALAIMSPAGAQDSTPLPSREGAGVGFTLGADLVSQYIWRGQDCGSAALQPTLGIASRGLALTAWGSVGIAEASDTRELDLTLSYTTAGLTLGLTDYWFSTGPAPHGRYLKYDAHHTNHIIEATVGYDLGPVALTWYTNLAGNDGQNQDGKRAYSSYAEAVVPFSLAGIAWTATAAAVPWATTTYQTTGFAVTNLALRATKDIRVTDSFALPVFAQLSANPCSGHAYLVFGITLTN